MESARISRSDRGLAVGVAIACVVHALAWSLLPPLFLGNLHTDTVEATSWATRWDWGYFKHPPLVVWLFETLLAAPGPRLLKYLVFSQATVLVASLFIWRTTRLFAARETAAMATLIYIASPPATYFAMQVNHNSISIPFGAAILYFGLRYLERRETRDIALLGLAGGLALLTKYQTAFFLMTLIALALGVPRYRWVWRDPRSYAGAALSLAILSPHLWWDWAHGWRTLLYASSDRPLRDVLDVGLSLNELLDGVLMSLVGPVLGWFILGRPSLRRSKTPLARIGWITLTAPVVVLVALGFASGQILRQGWLIPLTPAIAIGLALIFAPTAAPLTSPPKNMTSRAIFVSLGQVLAFAAFLFGRAATNHPVAAYSLNSVDLARKVKAVWNAGAPGPIPCMLIPNRTFGLAIMLHLDPLPVVVDLPPSPLVRADLPRDCAATGGLALVPDGLPVNDDMRAMGFESTAVAVGTSPEIGAFKWVFQVYTLPKEP